MKPAAAVETGRDRKALAADAGFGRISLASTVAGVLTAYGAFAILAGIIAGILDAVDADIDVAANWDDLGIGGGLVVAGLLLAAYLFGGYVAGRMARRAGVLHGLVVLVLGLVVVAVAAVLARELAGSDITAADLRDLGVPTTGSEWSDVATFAGIASLVAMAVGAIGGGMLGERWHTKLVARALDPSVGAEAEAYRKAQQRAAEAEELRLEGRERRTEAVQRVRTATPTRTDRVDPDTADPDTVSTGTATAGVDERVTAAPPAVVADEDEPGRRARRHDDAVADERGPDPVAEDRDGRNVNGTNSRR